MQHYIEYHVVIEGLDKAPMLVGKTVIAIPAEYGVLHVMYWL